MIALIQRVLRAQVDVAGQCVGRIDAGLLVFIGVKPNDSGSEAARLAQRILKLRVFDDAQGRMNLSLADTGGGLLLVPQFTLAADTSKGNRPGFSTAAAPHIAEPAFELVVASARAAHAAVATGVFGAHMQVSLINDGPVTFWLEAGADDER